MAGGRSSGIRSAVVIAAKTSPTLASCTVSPAARTWEVTASRDWVITSRCGSLHTRATARMALAWPKPKSRAHRARSTSETCSLSSSSRAPGSTAYDDDPKTRSRMMPAAAAMRSATISSRGPGPPVRSSHTSAPLPSSTLANVLVVGMGRSCRLRPSGPKDMKTPRSGSWMPAVHSARPAAARTRAPMSARWATSWSNAAMTLTAASASASIPERRREQPVHVTPPVSVS